MAWIRLDDQIAHHPKFNRCTPTACWLYVSCIGHAQKYLTNGFIARTDLRTISHVRRPENVITQLVRAGLMEKAPDGYRIHDYLDFNDSKEVVVAKRRELREVRSKAGRAGAMAKWQKAWQVASGLPETVASNLPSTVSSPIPSHPISTDNQLIRNSSTAAPPRLPVENSVHAHVNAVIPVNGNGHHRPSDFQPRRPGDNLKAITKIAQTALNEPDPPSDFSSLLEVVKKRSAKAKILYDSEVVGKAAESALAQRARKRRAH